MIGINVKNNYAVANKMTRLLIINNLLLRPQITSWQSPGE